MNARIERVVYGGLGLTRIPGEGPDARSQVGLVPFTLPGECVDVEDGRGDELKLLRVIKASAERVQPGCPHFGVCGGCHLQMGSYPEQLHIKREVLEESLGRAGVQQLPVTVTHAGEPWGYRNRIRLHVLKQNGGLHFGYRERDSKAVFAAQTCPIAAPLLWSAAEAMLALAQSNLDMQRWLYSADEVELFCDDAMAKLQITLLVKNARTSLPQSSFERAMRELQATISALAGAGAARVHPRTGEFQSELAAWGTAGLMYQVKDETYWVSRGGFFQVNRFLLPTMVDLVCNGRTGALTWDLFAGVGLFARVLAQNFERVTAVEANPVAARELASALRRMGGQHTGVQATTIEFLRHAVIERDRPQLIVLDPPRAGAGQETCELLVRIAAPEIVYVSCDPVTLGRDLAVLVAGCYGISALHLVDLFPQTYHQEAIVVLHRSS